MTQSDENTPPPSNEYLDQILDKDISQVFWHTGENAPSQQHYFVNTFLEYWAGEVLSPAGKNLHRAGLLRDCTLYLHLAAQTNLFRWLALSVDCGQYDLVMRELRTLLEVIFPTYYIDVAFEGKTLEEKLVELDNIEKLRAGYGKKAFELSGVENWQNYYALYRRLCEYTHLSSRVTGGAIRNGAVEGYAEATTLQFDAVRYSECVDTWKMVASLAVKLLSNLSEPAQGWRKVFTIEEYFK